MFNICNKRIYFYLVSTVLVAISLLAIFIWKPVVGIDFTGGSTIEIASNGEIFNPDKVIEIGKAAGFSFESVKSSDNNKMIIKSGDLSNEQYQKIISELKKVDSSVTEESFQNVGPTVSNDLTTKAIWAVIVASIGIILYITYAFRKLPKRASSWHFGLTAVVALLHDLIVTTGFVTIVGHYFHWMQVDSLFITALLTIMGFSVHDTIVVFDRLRENLIKHPMNDFESLANDSISQTISRSINTSLTTIFVLLTLFLLGGDSIKHFVLTLIAGITFGTYSSIFIATMLLVSWNKRTELAKTN